MMRTSKVAPLALLLALGGSSLMAQAGKVDSAIPGYSKTSGVSGNLNSVGSDTLANLMTLWAEGFQKQYPNVRIQIEAKGSSTAPPALIAGTSQIGPMSREMKSDEIDAFEKKYGYKPTLVKVAIDALAVYVNKDTPIEQLTIQQVDGIFSKGRACGGKAIKTWGDAGVKDPKWASKPISLYGRNSASGTYGFFKEHALCKGDYKDTVKEQPGSASVVQGVTEDVLGMGYSGIGYKTSGVKTLRIAKTAAAGYFGTDAETVLAGKYPLSRYLFLYINQAPSKPLDPLVREFIKYILSQEGQQVVVKDGFLPVPAKIAGEGRQALK
jgi:phosphate transport system substrate-binding protein